jgi:hypothetical protein
MDRKGRKEGKTGIGAYTQHIVLISDLGHKYMGMYREISSMYK